MYSPQVLTIPESHPNSPGQLGHTPFYRWDTRLESSWDSPEVSAGEGPSQNVDLSCVVCRPDSPFRTRPSLPLLPRCCVLPGPTEPPPRPWPEEKGAVSRALTDTQVGWRSPEGRAPVRTTLRDKVSSNTCCGISQGFCYNCFNFSCCPILLSSPTQVWSPRIPPQ